MTEKRYHRDNLAIRPTFSAKYSDYPYRVVHWYRKDMWSTPVLADYASETIGYYRTAAEAQKAIDRMAIDF